MNFYFQKYENTHLKLYLVSNEENLVGLIFPTKWEYFKEKFKSMEERDTPIIKVTRKQLDEYFSGERTKFDLPTELIGTEFQKKVWDALKNIPYGETRTYKQQAEMLRKPLASRAVGRANGLNPMSIIYPCHRVVGSSGAMTGYGGGLDTKEFLLKFESKQEK